MPKYKRYASVVHVPGFYPGIDPCIRGRRPWAKAPLDARLGPRIESGEGVTAAVESPDSIVFGASPNSLLSRINSL